MPRHIIEQVQQICRLQPTAPALRFDSIQLNYAQLECAANNISALLASYPIERGAALGIYLPRSHWLVTTLLGVLQSGFSYIPLDPSQPAARTQTIIEDAQLKHVICTAPDDTLIQASASNHLSLIAIDFSNLDVDSSSAAPKTEIDPQAQAYSIYTSGTTGRPKGVKVSHHNLMELLVHTAKIFDFTAQDTWCLFHSPSFDFSVWEIFGALHQGAELVIASQELSRDSASFYAFIEAQNINILNQTPSAFYALMAVDQQRANSALRHLRYVIFGGEALTLSKLKPWMSRHPSTQTQLVNMYGITETTVHVSYKFLDEACVNQQSASAIGHPLPHLQVHLVDSALRAVAAGETGEMLISGSGVSLGYHNRAQLNAEKFIAYDSDGQTVRAYRSGDLARRLNNGELIYLGRKDRQIKVRGYRIEPGEIEHAMNQLDAIEQSLVLAHSDAHGHQQLIAFVVLKNPAQNNSSQAAEDTSTPLHIDRQLNQRLHQALQQQLPHYMLPAQICCCRALPLNANHKADTQKLLDWYHQYRAQSASTPVTEFTSTTEAQLATLWQQVLQGEAIDRQASFFSLGGHSLLAAQLLLKVQQHWGVTLKMHMLKDTFTLAYMAQLIDQAQAQ